MDLVEVLTSELDKLNLTDKLQIAQYIYRRTGELFKYDPLWIFANDDELEDLRNKEIDINNVEDFDITCFSWSKLYHKLLRHFNIPSRVKFIYNNRCGDTPTHAYVEVYINGKAYLADLTASYKDMMGIKFGLDTYYNCQLAKTYYNDKYTFDNTPDTIYKKNIDVEKMLENLKEKVKKADRLLTSMDEFTYIVYHYISEFINEIKAHTGYVIGIKYIQLLLKTFLGSSYLMQNIFFFDREQGIYVAVHQVPVDGIMHYFAYKLKDADIYEFKEISIEEVNDYFKKYDYKLSRDLNVAYLSMFTNFKKKTYE